MCKVVISLCMCGGILASCSSGESNTNANDSITGAYVREFSREILHQSSGDKVGMRTVRDTIKITPSGDGYKVVNARWRMNDYDQEGWVNMDHGESRPLPTFEASYDRAANVLNSNMPGIVPELHVNGNTLSVGGDSKISYTKLNN